MAITPKLRKGLGRRKDREDSRDLHVPRFAHAGIGAPLPARVDTFAGLDLPVYDQGDAGSCTANAGVLYRRWLAQRFVQYSSPDQDLSRLFLYYQERKLEGDISSDGGAEVRDTFRVLARIGVCSEAADPYSVGLFASAAVNDSPGDLADAADYRIGAYHRVLDVDTAKQCLASGYAIELGFVVYESFESIGRDGLMLMPEPSEQILGGHAVVIYGYDDTLNGGSFLVRNSWGEQWGANGDFFMPYAFLADAQLSDFDMWMGHLGKPWSVISG
jgi:C1A family cysteine protease